MNQVPLLKYIKPSNLYGPTITWNNHNELMLHKQSNKEKASHGLRKYLFANKKIYNWVTEIKINKKVANRAN